MKLLREDEPAEVLMQQVVSLIEKQVSSCASYEHEYPYKRGINKRGHTHRSSVLLIPAIHSFMHSPERKCRLDNDLI